MAVKAVYGLTNADGGYLSSARKLNRQNLTTIPMSLRQRLLCLDHLANGK
jgi:hypothetical protein